jgi:hypothetical protein
MENSPFLTIIILKNDKTTSLIISYIGDPKMIAGDP